MARWTPWCHYNPPVRMVIRSVWAIIVAIGFWGTAVAENPEAGLLATGQPPAPALMKVLKAEIVTGLKHRQITSDFARFEGYSGYQLNSTVGSRRAICRLKWYDHLFRNPLTAPIEAEQFTRQLHKDVCREHQGLDRVLATARAKLDLGVRPARSFATVGSPENALDVVKQALDESQFAYARALSTLTRSELWEMTSQLKGIFCSENRVGHTLYDRGTGTRLCQLLEKMDRGAMQEAAEALAPLADRQLLTQLDNLPTEESVTVAGADGPIIRRIETPSGAIVVGGREANTYKLDEMPGVAVVIDLGGDDTYEEGTVSPKRPVLVVIDLSGNDTYRGTRTGIQGSAVMGVSMLLDVEGNDTYRGGDLAQGSCIAGAGILIDCAGNDYYRGVRRAQGSALGGVAILIDRAGNDVYRAAMWAQGYGGPLGFGLLDDIGGKDFYYAGGLYLDSYPETPGYEGWSQGVGCGPRQVADGGIGVILDGGGDDVYEYDYMSHGGGYWFGVGFARDFGGNDHRLGATRKSFSGAARSQQRFQRFGAGFGCHYSMGFCFDDQGDDSYDGTIMGLGFAWDDSVGVLCDFGGNDRYLATGGGTQGNGAQAGLGIIYDVAGDDVYEGYGQGYADPNIWYHRLPRCGGNFSFVIDHGGKDEYGCGAANNSYTVRGTYGGFLIDRPARQTTAGQDTQTKETAKTAGKTDPKKRSPAA